MTPRLSTRRFALSRAVAVTTLVGTASLSAIADDWPEFRGPNRDGRSTETGLPEHWSPDGENLLWRIPSGGRSSPVVLGDHVLLFQPVGQGADLQERLVAVHADTGETIWEQRFNVSLSDVPPHRVAWSAPAADPATGNVYVLGVGGHLAGVSHDGRLLWSRSLSQEFGVVTTHGGRTMSPVIDGDLVIVTALNSGWGDLARPSNRFFAFDKRTGETVWIATPQQRHFDTNYAQPIVADVGGQRLLIVGGTDGTVYAVKVATGETVWSYEVTKRSLNTAVVMAGTKAIVTHSEENLGTSEMGLIAAVDATATGAIGPAQVAWSVLGWQGGFSSPVVDEAASRVYSVDNGAILGAFDLGTGKELWRRGLGTLQKAPLVLADGKLYVGTENGTFYILRPKADGVDVLDEDRLGTEAEPEAIVAGPAISNGRVFFSSMAATYAIGPKRATKPFAPAPATEPRKGTGDPAWLQVVPSEVVLRPGETRSFEVRLFDAGGDFLREAPATWTAEGTIGTVTADGTLTAAGEAGSRLGSVKAAVGSLTGMARVRVYPPLPWRFDFEPGSAVPAAWTATLSGKYALKTLEDRNVVARPRDMTLGRRGRVFMGPPDMADYTVEADVRVSKYGRGMGDIGVIAQQYTLVLFGNGQKMELQPWQPATAMTVSAPFAWQADTWYRIKLRVENLPDGTTRAQGKAWPVGSEEPAAWTVEKIDPHGRRSGAPGLYADASAELFFDNVTVTEN